MNDKALDKLKAMVTAAASDQSFIHHQWFVAHHLNIIDDIVAWLLPQHPLANVTVCRAMVWVHDWGKILTNKGANEEEATHHHIHHTLPQLGFSRTDINLIASVYDEMESLTPTSSDFLIETKIISSADALSHYIGPFFAIYWQENAHMSVNELIAANLKKVEKDQKKILLPEVMAIAQQRMKMIADFSHTQRNLKHILPHSSPMPV